MRKLKIVLVILAVILVIASITFLVVRNIQVTKSYEAAEAQITSLESKLDAIGYFTDVITVKTGVKMGQLIKDEDLTTVSKPSDELPENIVTDKKDIIGKYWRIGVTPDTEITFDLIDDEGYTGTVYTRELYMDANLPIGLTVGDYIDVRIVLPGGEEFVVFAHKRVNAKYDDTLVMQFDEADLWLYTSMMIDRALYKPCGMKLYATRYVDPGKDNLTVAYYPMRKEAVDIMSINPNLTEEQRNRIWNESLRNAIDEKLSYYTDNTNKDVAKLVAGVAEEASRAEQAKQYFEELLKSVESGSSETDLVDPTTGVPEATEGTTVNDSTTSDSTNVVQDGATDADGNGSTVSQSEQIGNLSDDMLSDESTIE
jgi:type II secretory pathway pseudopilin PulG